MSLVAIIPTFAAARGTAAILDPSDTTTQLAWGRVNGTVVLEVRDADLNAATTVTNEAITFTACAASGDLRTIQVANVPIVDKTSDGVINFSDVTVGSNGNANTTVFSANGSNGVVILQCTAAGATAGTTSQALDYKAASVDTVGSTTVATSIVKVTSNGDTTGIGVVLTETTASSGILRATIKLVSTASDAAATPPELKVSTLINDSVKLSYTDSLPTPVTTVSDTLTVESFAPIFANTSPANKYGTQVSRPEVSADVTDGDSLVKKSTIKIWWGQDTDSDGDIDSASEDIVNSAGGTIGTITGGYTVKQRITGAVPTSDFQLYWWVISEDTAGNRGVIDRSPSITEGGTTTTDVCVPDSFPATAAALVGLNAGGLLADTAAIAGCQPYVARIDFTGPSVSSAITGQWWDTSITTTDKTNSTASKSLNTSVLVTLDEDLDGTTVAASDFTVAGETPSAAAWYDGAKTKVFLTVSAQEPNAKPQVILVGNLQDTAGNNNKTATADTTKTAGDGIAPTVTVTVTGTAAGTVPATKNSVTIQFSTDEDVSVSAGSVVVQAVNALAGLAAGDISTASPSLISTRTWTVSVTPGGPGLFNVYVSTNDVTGNANVGTKGHITDPSNSAAILFEKDGAVAAPTLTQPSASTSDANTFIIVDFAGEGKEYGLDASGDFGLAGVAAGAFDGTIVTKKDTHKAVTLTSATLDKVDILSSINTADDISFLYKSSSLSLGTHTVKVKATDAAGNSLAETTFTFKVTDKALFKVTLKPGWNMVSLPNSPADPAINSVISSSLPIDTVLTHDADAQGGPWLTAVRDTATGNLVGSLTSITAGRAYWVHTTTFEPISVDIPGTAGGQQITPPTVNLQVGWNLVPVIDVSGTKVSGDATSTTASQYLTGVKFSRIYEYDTLAGQFQVVLSTDTLTVGKGYWVYVTEAAVLVP
jgi:hypothetical protein